MVIMSNLVALVVISTTYEPSPVATDGGSKLLSFLEDSFDCKALQALRPYTPLVTDRQTDRRTHKRHTDCYLKSPMCETATS